MAYTNLCKHTMHSNAHSIYVTSNGPCMQNPLICILGTYSYMNIHVHKMYEYKYIHIITYHMLSTKSILHIFATFRGRIIHHPPVRPQRLRHSKSSTLAAENFFRLLRVKASSDSCRTEITTSEDGLWMSRMPRELVKQ